jgi:uncharacterized protein (TIGR02996 family)
MHNMTNKKPHATRIGQQIGTLVGLGDDQAQRDGLLAAIRETPDDDDLRLIYADWLDEHGNSARAEFIRLQCQLEALPLADPRRQRVVKRVAAIEKQCAGEWVRPLHEALSRSGCAKRDGHAFRRGFLEYLELTPRRAGFLAAAATFLKREPLRHLTLTGHPDLSLADALAEVADCSCLPALDGLCLTGLTGATLPTGESMRQLGSSPNLPRLATLNLVVDVSAGILAGLVGTPLARRLAELEMDVWEEDMPGVLDLLVGSRAFPALSGLVLGCPLSVEGMRRLAHSPNLPALRWLCLDGVDGPCAAVLLNSPLWGRLTGLYLQALDAEAGELVIGALPRSRLTSLGMVIGGLTGAHVEALVGLPSWGALEELNLNGNILGAASGVALAGSPHLGRLTTLALSGCSLGEAGGLALAASPYAHNLRQLWLVDGPLSARRALKQRFGGAFVWRRG